MMVQLYEVHNVLHANIVISPTLLMHILCDSRPSKTVILTLVQPGTDKFMEVTHEQCLLFIARNCCQN